MEPVSKLPNRQYEIDLLRFLAALAVVFYHYASRAYGPDNLSPLAFPVLDRFTRYGYLGVQLFFIISGYVVLLSAQGKTVRGFFISRVQRLYPAFWVACTLTFVVVRLWGNGSANELSAPLLEVGIGQYLQNMSMLHEFWGQENIDQSYWSLTVEISFYFIISLLISYKLMPHVNLIIALWLGYAGVASFLPGEGKFFSHLFFPMHAPYFLAGMLFFLLREPAGRTWVRYSLLLLSYLVAARYIRYGTEWHRVPDEAAIAIVTGFFLLFGLVAFGKLNFSRQAWLAKLGALTYPLYLLHGHIGYVAFHRIGPFINKYVMLAGVVAIMLLLAHIIASWVEKPLGRLLGQQVSRLLDYAGSLGDARLARQAALADKPRERRPQKV